MVLLMKTKPTSSAYINSALRVGVGLRLQNKTFSGRKIGAETWSFCQNVVLPFTSYTENPDRGIHC